MYLDIVVLLIMIFMLFRGYCNGFFINVISLVGIVVNVVLAKLLTPKLMALLNIEVSGAKYTLLYAGVFLGLYILIGLFIGFLKKIMKNNVKSSIDSFLGLIFGFFKGSVLIFVLVLLYLLLEGQFTTLKKYSRGSRSKKVFVKVFPYAQKYIPMGVEKLAEKERYREKIQGYLDNILKETN